jgi:hypothetical protein
MSSNSPPHALRFLFLLFSGWVNRHQQEVIEYLTEENRVLREGLGGRRLRLNDDQPKTSRREEHGPRTKGAPARSRHCHAGHDPPLVSTARREKVRRIEKATLRATSDQAGDRRAHRPHGQRQPHLGLHKNTRRPPAPRSRDRQEHRQTDPAGPRARASAGAKENDGTYAAP